jgi:beta-fructofuranosidase
MTSRIFGSTLLTFSFALTASPAEPANEAIARATAALTEAAPRAQADPARPIFHVAAPAQWMNDPNGPIYYRGRYHLFYQLHPFSDESGPKYWGHVRSRDLAKWEPLPIALAPSLDAGEAEIWSGCCTVNGRGKPMIFYTSIARGKSAQTHAEQWAAISDDDMLTWRKCPDNPVLSEALHEGNKIYDWRDPFIFRDGKRAFMVTGGNLNQGKGGQAVVNIYEAQNSDFTQWKYRGVLFQLPDSRAATAECPNFFKLGAHWVLFVSPYGKVQYFVGDFNPDTCRFQPRTHGVLDVGPNFYAPNTMQVPDGRRLVWGWINGFPRGHGWNGCLSLPRLLTLSGDGQLRQSPAPELKKLRGRSVQWRNLHLKTEGLSLPLPKTNSFEIRMDIDLDSAESLVLQFKSGIENARPVSIELSRSELNVKEPALSLVMGKSARDLSLRIFIDRSVLEVFANDALCATKVISPLDANPTLEVQSRGGNAQAKRVECWPLKTIW